MPILVVGDDSYQTATRVHDLDPGLPVDDLERIEGVVNAIADLSRGALVDDIIYTLALTAIQSRADSP